MAKKIEVHPLDAALAMLMVHAENCETNAAIAQDAGDYASQTNYEKNAKSYRLAIAELRKAAK